MTSKLYQIENTIAAPPASSTVLALDPSKTATGWAVLRDSQVIANGCFKFKSELGKKASSIDKFWEFNLKYTEFIFNIVRKYWVAEICAEFPHGTKSYHAAVSLTTVKNIIGSIKPMLGIPVHFYTEGSCKKHYFGRFKNVEKSETVKEMKARFGDWKLELPKAKYGQEAVCDALLVYLKHINL